jgi:hypothetical protein
LEKNNYQWALGDSWLGKMAREDGRRICKATGYCVVNWLFKGYILADPWFAGEVFSIAK